MKVLNKIVNMFSPTAQAVNEGEKGSTDVNAKMQEKLRALAGEGIVLLKNDNAVLPIKSDDNVAVFGRTQYDYFCVGYGSGGDVRAPYKVNLIDGLTNCNVSINHHLAKVYSDWRQKHIADEGFWGHWPFYFEEMPISHNLVKEVAEQSTIAVVVIGRAAGEDREQKLASGSFYLAKDEIAMLDIVTAHFDKVVLVVDSGNVIDFEQIVGYGDKISAIVLAWQGGMESGNALADVLCGRVNPSGKLTDTIAKTYQDYPSSSNFGGKKFNNYVEDIYVGYRYFETFAKDRVLYPFGYGLSYTQFEMMATLLKTECGSKIVVSVKNVGNTSGKEVVQVYVQAPQGVLGKPLRQLVAFEKTALLEVGQEQEIVFDIDKNTLASYDDSGESGNKACWVLEKGEYTFCVGNDVRNAQEVGSISIECDEVVARCNTACSPSPKHAFCVLKPHISKEGSVEKIYAPVHCEDGYLKERIEKHISSLGEYKNAQNKDFKLTFGDVKVGNCTIEEFIAELDDEMLQDLCHGDLRMNSPLGAKGNAGAFGGISERLRAKGVPNAITTDGPSGIRLSATSSLLPCGTAMASSWNLSLVGEVYAMLGDEMIKKGSDVLLAPGINIHRNVLCGRNFEYFAEDPYIAGKMASAVISGLQSKGVAGCVKHFACNNQEKKRFVNDSRLSERALREIYLKAFMICVRDANPLAIMTSYNKINGIYSYHNFDLATTILREEWGYQNLVMTDWWTKNAKNPLFKGVDNNAYRVRAQVDVLMPGGSRILGRYDNSTLKSLKKGGLARKEMQRTAKNVLNFLLKIK